ncbi:MAG: DUF2461 domain-containing protein [Bacteroidetes bacterium]|nr:DUF2461 domain-containing protein [Bacteroidota bacterium]
MATLSKSNLEFLKALKQNNNRDWFTNNKDVYEKQHAETILFADAVLNEMRKHDNIETLSGKKSLMRIYRDVRFSKDKSPYKTNWGIGFTRATKLLRGGYYVHLAPGESFVGGGFWAPESADLTRMRKEISLNTTEFRAILNDKNFKNTFGQLQGEKLKTVPKGFEKDHPALDLLQFKQYLISRKFTDKEVTAPDFYKKVNETFKAMRPFFDFMSTALTTNENGELLNN